METDHISQLLARDPLMCHFEVVARDTLPEVGSTYTSAFVCNTRHNQGNIGSPCTWMRSVTTSTRTHKTTTRPVHEHYERTMLAVVAQRSYSPEPYIIYIIPFVVNTVSLS